jgi:beta-glucanase (GH16 family)
MKLFPLFLLTSLILNFAFGQELIWEDNFDSFNKNKWTKIEGNGCPELCGFGNNELQYYSGNEKNLRTENGKLIIEAHLDTLSKRYSSAKIITKNKGDWNTCRIDIKAKLPKGRGTWPAFWMLPSIKNMRWPHDGEIDIMEHVGFNQGWIYGTIHTGKYNHMKGTHKSDSIYIQDAGDSFHIYSIIWEKTSITWLVDGVEFQKLERGEEKKDGWPFDTKFHLILNLAIGGNWGGKYGVDDKIWPQRIEIDYVKVFRI